MLRPDRQRAHEEYLSFRRCDHAVLAEPLVLACARGIFRHVLLSLFLLGEGASHCDNRQTAPAAFGGENGFDKNRLYVVVAAGNIAAT